MVTDTGTPIMLPYIKYIVDYVLLQLWVLRLLCFVAWNTRHFDDSHNWRHASIVADVAMQICKMDEDVQALFKSKPELYRVILATAWLHDVCDHKYPQSISKEKLYAFIHTVMPSVTHAEWVITLINNISYSKQAKGLCDKLPAEYQLALDVVRDADRYEAIGKERGLLRCRQYTVETNKGLSDSEITRLVYEHCVEKLEILLPKRYICTKAGRRISMPRHAEIVHFMQQYNPNFKPTPIDD